MSKVRNPKDWSATHQGSAVALGVAVGVAIGAAVGEVGLWMALGAPVGVAVYGVILLLNGSRQSGDRH